MDEKKIDYGSIQIHKEVLEDICVEAIAKIEGVSLIRNSLCHKLLGIFQKRRYEGILISIDKENQVSINCRVSVQLGINIPEIANHLQSAIREAIVKTAEVDLKEITVDIQNMERGTT